MNPIPTEYKGTMFRSRLEARYAAALDALNMRWSYETIGLNLNGSNYLPDFWLPETRTFLEVKGPHKERLDLVRLAQRIENSKPPKDTDGNWQILFVVGDELGRLRDGDVGEVNLSRCPNCEVSFFYEISGGWGCRACHHYEGNGTVENEHHQETIELPQMQWQPKGDEKKEAQLVSRIVDEVMQRIKH